MDKELWKQAQIQAKEEYEEEWGEGSWEERADKYEREDYVWAAYEKITNKQKGEQNMHVWILTTSERDDEFCEHDNNIVTVYSQEHLDEALKHYEKLCNDRTENGYEIEIWEDKFGYHFSAELEDYNWVKMKNVSLEKKVVM